MESTVAAVSSEALPGNDAAKARSYPSRRPACPEMSIPNAGSTGVVQVFVAAEVAVFWPSSCWCPCPQSDSPALMPAISIHGASRCGVGRARRSCNTQVHKGHITPRKSAAGPHKHHALCCIVPCHPNDTRTWQGYRPKCQQGHQGSAQLHNPLRSLLAQAEQTNHKLAVATPSRDPDASVRVLQPRT